MALLSVPPVRYVVWWEPVSWVATTAEAFMVVTFAVEAYMFPNPRVAVPSWTAVCRGVILAEVSRPATLVVL